MKKTFALLAALMLVVMMLPTTAMAYEAPEISETKFPHTLTLTEANLQKLPDGTVLQYNYSVGNAEMKIPSIDEDGNTVYTNGEAKGVTGKPTITGTNGTSSAVFDEDSEFVDGVSTVEMTVDWTGVTVTEPGSYLWKVTKAIDLENSQNHSDKYSDEDTAFYLFVIVINSNTNDKLQVKSVGIDMKDELNAKTGSVNDTFPVKKVSLQIKKTIQGELASANQYFPFKVQLNTLPGTYNITGIVSNVPVTAYNTSQVNPETILVQGNGQGEVKIWLKHNEVAKIEELPFGSSYTIIEEIGATDGFKVSANVEGDVVETSNVANDYTVTDTSLTSDTTVTYTNTKKATTPTGITLQTAAPVMGILLAMSLLAVLYLGKRRESAA